MYIPSTDSPSALVPGDSNSVSAPPFPDIEPSATWNGSSLRPQSWRRAWKTAPWIRLLSGMTLPPSTAQRGVESWISSLRASPASHGAWPGEGAASRTSGGSGLTSRESFATWNRESRSWRTSAASLPGMEALVQSSVTWPTSGSMLSGWCYQRRPQALPTGGSGSSSWPTAQAHDAQGPKTPAQVATARERTGAGVANLNEAVQEWQTPASDSFRSRGGNRKDEMGLDQQARMGNWQTPDAGGFRSHHSGDGTKTYELLTGQAENWPTPDTQNDRDGSVRRAEQSGKHALSLHHAVARWATPNAHDGRRPGSDATSTQGRNLKREAEEAYFRPDPENANNGAPSSPSTPSSPRRLNPLFVEWLMGWPHGWTSVAPRGCGCWGTGWCRNRPRSRGASSANVRG